MITDDQIKLAAYDQLIEALKLTTRALMRAKSVGAEQRVEESLRLLQAHGVKIERE